jgi:GMP synthase (glutamine-hydrolysing)
VRLLCNDGEPDREGLEEAGPLLEELGARHGLHSLILPIRSVGVKADLRAYEHPVLLTGGAEWDDLMAAASAITARVPGINRCIWNLDLETPTSARPVAATVTRERLDTLREADHLVMDALRRHDLYRAIWQCPTVLVPLELDGKGELVVIRPVISERAMTASPFPVPLTVLQELRDEILAVPGVGAVALDITSKPPGTIEWE